MVAQWVLGAPARLNATNTTKGGPMEADSPFIPKLTTTDWNAEWVELQRARRAADSAEHWDERSKTYKQADSPTPYVEAFLEYAGVRPGESVLDMGCGTGALAIPLGSMGHRVIAADFSRGMLDRVQEDCERLGLADVSCELMSWSDDWDAHGVGPDSVDVALASRSIATADLGDSLERLATAARRRCCLTLPTGSSPRTDARILSAIGLQPFLGRDHLYAFMILSNRGYVPEVRYIASERLDTFASEEAAWDKLERMVVDTCGTMVGAAEMARALGNLRAWLPDNLVANPEAGRPDGRGGSQGPLRLREPRVTTWAFIAWDVQRAG